jgi:hypothetical protein
MKVSIGVLAASFPALVSFAQVDMPAALALRLKRVLSVGKKELETFGDVEKATADKLGAVVEQKEDKSFYKFPSPEVQKDFVSAMLEARKEEIELPGVAFTEDDLLKIANLKASVLADLDWLVAA